MARTAGWCGSDVDSNEGFRQHCVSTAEHFRDDDVSQLQTAIVEQADSLAELQTSFAALEDECRGATQSREPIMQAVQIEVHRRLTVLDAVHSRLSRLEGRSAAGGGHAASFPQASTSASSSSGPDAASSSGFDDKVRGIVEDMLADKLDEQVQELLSSHWSSVDDLFDECKEELLVTLRESVAGPRVSAPRLEGDSDRVQSLLAERDCARRAGDFGRADVLRAELRRLGVRAPEPSLASLFRETSAPASGLADAVEESGTAETVGNSALDLFSDDFYTEALEEPGSLSHHILARELGLFD